MAITKEKLISDVILQFNQSVLTDDSQLEDDQVAFWLDYYLNDLVKREIVAEKRKGNQIPPVYIGQPEVCTLIEETTADIDDEDQRMYINLTNEVLDLPRDAGVVKVTDFDLNIIHPATLEGIEMLSDLRFAAPSSENPLYYRNGKRLYVKGFNSADLEFNDILVWYVKRQIILEMDDTDEVIVSDQLLPVLIDLAVAKGKLELFGTQPDTASDGKDTKKTVYHTQIQNPQSQDQTSQNVDE